MNKIAQYVCILAFVAASGTEFKEQQHVSEDVWNELPDNEKANFSPLEQTDNIADDTSTDLEEGVLEDANVEENVEEVTAGAGNDSDLNVEEEELETSNNPDEDNRW